MLRWIGSNFPATTFCVMALLWVAVGQLKFLRGYSSSAAIVISPEQLDFGEVESQSDFVHTVLIRNPSSKALQVTGFNTSCACTSVQPDKFTLAPRAERQVGFRMNLGVRLSSHAGKMEYPFQVRFSPVVEGQPAQQQWTLSGRVLRNFVANEPEVWLGSRSSESSEQLSRVVRVTSRIPMNSVEVVCDPPWITASIRKAESSTNWELTLGNRTSPLPPNLYTGDVKIIGHTSEGVSVASTVATYATEVTYDVRALPQKLVLSRQPALAPSSEIITVTSSGAKAFDVTGVTVDPEGAVSVDAIEQSEGDNCKRFRVTLGKAPPSTTNSQLIFSISDPENGLIYNSRVAVTAIGEMLTTVSHVE